MSGPAVLHEKLVGRGGAQNVAFEHARALGAPVYAGWVDEEYVPGDVEARQIFADRSRHLLKLPSQASDLHNMLAWQHVEEAYGHDELVLNQTTCTWLVPRDDQAVVQYAHHPPRVPYDMWHRRGGGWLNSIVSTAKRVLYRHTLEMPDVLVANSELTASRFRRYFDIDPDMVVYPPVDLDAFGPGVAGPTGDYYLALGRLTPNKRTVEVVEAAESEGVELVVAGGGPRMPEVRAAAGPNTQVLGEVGDGFKAELMSGARAFVMNAEQEDYGLTPVEALASGTPVLAVDEGYTPEHVDDGRTGIVYERGSLAGAIRRMEAAGVGAGEGEIADSVSDRGLAQFERGMTRALELARERRRWPP
jgi:glycosyltransferase involved in cell wall biosynthesis